MIHDNHENFLLEKTCYNYGNFLSANHLYFLLCTNHLLSWPLCSSELRYVYVRLRIWIFEIHTDLCVSKKVHHSEYAEHMPVKQSTGHIKIMHSDTVAGTPCNHLCSVKEHLQSWKALLRIDEVSLVKDVWYKVRKFMHNFYILPCAYGKSHRILEKKNFCS